VSDATAVRFDRIEGLREVTQTWSSRSRLIDAHQATNVVLTRVDDATGYAVSKGLSLYGNSEASWPHSTGGRSL
jgi:hypothetical protein